MRRTYLIGLLVASGLGLFALAIVSRPTLKAQQAPALVATNAVAGAFGGGDPKEDSRPPVTLAARPMTVAETKIRLKLQEKVTMAFATETTLEDLVKYIQRSTVDKADFPDGIPVYLDPVGLQDADKTAASTIQISLKGIPLATSLKLALKQLSLDYWVHPDGLLIVTYEESEEMPVDASSVMVEEIGALRREVRELRNEIRFARGVEPLPHQGPGEPKQTPAMGAAGGLR